jgi:hypothetical protein
MHDPPDLDGLEDTLRAPVTQALRKDPAGRPASAELPAWLCWADHSSEPATETPASRQTVLPVGYATDEDMPRTGDQEPAPAVGAALVPLDRPEEPAAEDVDGRSGTKEIRVRRRGRAAAPVAMVATAAAALVTFLVTTGADNDGAPPAAPGGESSVPPPSPAAGHHARRPGSVPRSPVTHHTTAPDGGPRLVPEPTVRRVPRHSKAGGKGKGGTKAKGKRGPGG